MPTDLSLKSVHDNDLQLRHGCDSLYGPRLSPFMVAGARVHGFVNLAYFCTYLMCIAINTKIR